MIFLSEMQKDFYDIGKRGRLFRLIHIINKFISKNFLIFLILTEGLRSNGKLEDSRDFSLRSYYNLVVFSDWV